MKISIVGTGMFGFALGLYLGNTFLGNEKIKIVTYDSNKELMQHLRQCRTHLYHFKEKKLPLNVSFAIDKEELIEEADIVVLAVTSQAVRETIRDIKEYFKNGVIILNTAKALEIGTAKTFYEVAKDEMDATYINYTIMKISGGTFAEDLINGTPLGAEIACENPLVLKSVQDICSSSHLRIYGNTDLIGVEYAGAFKNVIAILAGIII